MLICDDNNKNIIIVTYICVSTYAYVYINTYVSNVHVLSQNVVCSVYISCRSIGFSHSYRYSKMLYGNMVMINLIRTQFAESASRIIIRNMATSDLSNFAKNSRKIIGAAVNYV